MLDFKDRRFGKFRIAFDILTDHTAVAQAVLRDVVVVRAEAMWLEGAVHYEGLHPAFEANNPVEEMARYSAVVHEVRNRDDGSITYRVEWIKQEPWAGMSNVLVVRERQGEKAA